MKNRSFLWNQITIPPVIRIENVIFQRIDKKAIKSHHTVDFLWEITFPILVTARILILYKKKNRRIFTKQRRTKCTFIFRQILKQINLKRIGRQ